jgi:hypothetical protein
MPAFGLPFTSGHVTGDLRRLLPPATVDALDAIGKQIQATVFDPLLYASSPEELRERFVQLFRTYCLQYASASLQLTSAAANEPNALATALMRELADWEAPSQAIPILGSDAATILTTAVDIMNRVLRRSLRTLIQTPGAVPQAVELQWFNGFVLFSMSVGPVLDALTRAPFKGRRENLVLLTMWARVYALQLYAFSRRLGWIPEATPVVGAENVGLATGTEEEERLLTEAGFEAWAQDLVNREEDGHSEPR